MLTSLLASARATLGQFFSKNTDDSERGDVPGWVLITLMSAGLVVTIWTVAGPALTSLFESAIAKVSSL